MASETSPKVLFEEFQERYARFASTYADAVAREEEARAGAIPDRDAVLAEAAGWLIE